MFSRNNNSHNPYSMGGQGIFDGMDIGLSMGEEHFIMIDGNPLFVSGSNYVFDPALGQYKLINFNENRITDECGRQFLIQNLIGRSWKANYLVTTFTGFECLNPFDLHTPRLCCVDVDGFIPLVQPEIFYSFGRVLCSDCYDKNSKRAYWRTLLGWLGYTPEVY